LTTVGSQVSTTCAGAANIGVVFATANQTASGASGTKTGSIARAEDGGAYLFALTQGTPYSASYIRCSHAKRE
jgi:hypothetical protein